MTGTYLIPAERRSIELSIHRSRFIATGGYVPTVDAARAFIAQQRSLMPDAHHHVYAFKVGFGSSVIEGMSDDGEPSGTAGPPILSVLRGADIGDIVIVVTRYFGGTKLGTGGLVRAYSDAARALLAELPTRLKLDLQTLRLETSYALYAPIRRLIVAFGGQVQDEVFAGEVTIIAALAAEAVPEFTQQLDELSAGAVKPVLL